MSTETIRYEKDGEGIVTLTLDDPNQSANTMNADFVESYAAVAKRLEDEADDITGIIVTSAKSTFFAGGDLRDLIQARPENAPDVAAQSDRIKAAMRTIETLGKPVVAAINGSALGGGLEIALACHHRIAVDNPKTVIGLPEVTLGLLPGAGGCVRVPRLLGIMNGLLNVLVQGQQMKVAKAKDVGVIDAIVPDTDTMLAEARAWIAEHPESAQPWDQKGYRMPGGAPSHPTFAQNAPALPANLKKQMKGAHYDAPHHIMAAVYEGAQVDVERAFEIETRYFVDLVCNSRQAKNMTQAFFFDLQAINKGKSRPDGYDQWKATKVAVLGAGMMGAGIAYQCAKSGIDVVLKDVSKDNAEKGKDYARSLVAKGVEKGKVTQDKGDALLDRIATTDDYADLAGCDLVIEAVFESTDLKHQVHADTEAVVDDDALLCSNTSTIPITELAEGVQRREDFIGLHFFSPVDKMPLVEIIRGEQTSDAALAKAIDVVMQIRKTPIVVNDSRGFFTSRVIGTFINEAVAALGEGVNPVLIERAGEAAGYPAPPLQLLDELTLTLPRKIRKEYIASVEAAGETYVPHPAEAVVDRMIDEFGREGRSAGKGFYEYGEDGKRVGLWSGLWDHFVEDADTHIHDGDDQLLVDLQERMLFAEALETVKCFDEGVLETFPDANIGSIFGIGFPAWTGGVAQYVDQYPGGTTGFV
ncbi:MAG: enoyl-CoA hydratase/isomerase family protein, partial [Acidimicrobiales bacterium]|nr:enoyl-CoA hydratase/isomerase family protein [Acidimicrobiales bacterium]